MSNRQRLTWQDGGAKAASEQPVLPIERAASAHPATPDEGPASPAYGGADPEADAYENGDTSSWAEDPTTGPYPNSAHPATPDEGPASPAYKAAAENLKIAVERKAAKCIRIAAAMLPGRQANLIEDQALDLMDLPDAAITATLSRLAEDEGKKEEEEAAETIQEEVEEDAKEAKKKAADDALLRRLLAEEEMDEEEVEETDAEGKKKATEVTAMSEIMATLQAMRAEIASLKAGKSAQDEEVEEEAEETDAEGKKKAGEDDVEAMLRSMLEEEVEVEQTACGPMAQDEAPEAPEAPVSACGDEMDIDMTDIDDPMGLMDDADLMDEGEEALLANLFADRRLAKKGEDEEDDEADEEVEEEVEEEDAESDTEAKKKAATRTAALKPQPKKASQGATRLGGVTRAAGNDISSLEKLWETAPDVSGVFK